MAPPRRLDVLGTFCPIPVLLAVREMRRLEVGDRLELLGDDPAMREDVPAWCDHAGHRLVEASEDEHGVLCFVVEKGSRP